MKAPLRFILQSAVDESDTITKARLRLGLNLAVGFNLPRPSSDSSANCLRAEVFASAFWSAYIRSSLGRDSCIGVRQHLRLVTRPKRQAVAVESRALKKALHRSAARRVIRHRGVHLHKLVLHDDGGHRCKEDSCGRCWGDEVRAGFVGGR